MLAEVADIWEPVPDINELVPDINVLVPDINGLVPDIWELVPAFEMLERDTGGAVMFTVLGVINGGEDFNTFEKVVAFSSARKSDWYYHTTGPFHFFFKTVSLPVVTSHLLITFANSLDAEQDRLNVGPVLESKPFDTLIMFLKEFFSKVNFEKS